MIRREKIICMSANGGEGMTLGKIAKAFQPHISTSEPDIDIFIIFPFLAQKSCAFVKKYINVDDIKFCSLA